MSQFYHMNCRANRVWWLRWPVPKRLLVWMQRGPQWMRRLVSRRLSRLEVWREEQIDKDLDQRTYRCSGCWLFIHEDY